MKSHPAKHETWADLAVYEDLVGAKALEAFLASKRIEARTYDDKLFRWFLFLRPPRITYRVQVRHTSHKFARDVLEADPPEILQWAIHCPSCDSLRIVYPQMTRKFILPTVLLHLGIIFRFFDHECYCEDCHFIWNLPGENVHPAPKPASQFPL